MVHTFENFTHSYWKKNKPIFVPSIKGENWGKKIKKKITELYRFDDFVYHFKDGSHVKALHAHRRNNYFCRIDIERYFYSIRRNRVKKALKDIGILNAESFAKWSTVKNPYDGGGYVVPYGFIQSPIIATVVLMNSAVGQYLRSLNPNVITVSIYMDDICLSSRTEEDLRQAFNGLGNALVDGGFTMNVAKTRGPSPSIDIFNCRLETADTSVLPSRIAEFYSVTRSDASVEGFETYVEIVRSHTWRAKRKQKRRRKAREIFSAAAVSTPDDVGNPAV